MPTGTVRDEIKIFRLRRVGYCLQRRAPWDRDGTRRKAINDVGVVWCRLLDIGPIDRTIRRFTITTEKAVDDRRIRLQTHALVEPIDEHSGDTRTLITARRLFLSDRSECDELVDVIERKAVDPTIPDALDESFLIRHQALDDFLTHHSTRKADCI